MLHKDNSALYMINSLMALHKQQLKSIFNFYDHKEYNFMSYSSKHLP